MTSFNVELLPAADEDLDDIFTYILLDNPEAANEVLDRVMTSLKYLEKFPYAGLRVMEERLKHFEFRMVISEPYIAFYRVIENTVYIYRILHGARDYIQILRNKR
ncbi:plasmid stabilization system protein [Gracilibacillus boraciitolerans JCM 21714]|uniref:Plasmid stabilization system protein n=1 Tax=Gracilibacillus boraciitolerans JCM 21714 TaxID=1298598 RepID=W4VLK8_9BACI|nr:type II toxin-antitoxin system RelE/ParE family toxin [Gracilibacillus boraciitolerans]GAE93713.1 plasmid stabilization system protein [Gracilibacillus boraciitolerans JCM 21714]